jgi:hypothetical protein
VNQRLCALQSFAILLLGPAPALAQGTFTAKTVKTSSPSYELIGLVAEGPSYGPSGETVRGRFQRVLLVYRGLAYHYPEFRIETLTYGDEACCRRVVAAKALDLQEVSSSGVPLPEAATTEITFVRWQSPQSAVFGFGKLQCTFSGLGQSKVHVVCKQ